jgi:hypothetical protein
MFEVVISVVHTGRVERKVFDTREEADRYVDRRLAKAAASKRGTARRLRAEVYPWRPPVVKSLPQLGESPAPAAVA